MRIQPFPVPRTFPGRETRGSGGKRGENVPGEAGNAKLVLGTGEIRPGTSSVCVPQILFYFFNNRNPSDCEGGKI